VSLTSPRVPEVPLPSHNDAGNFKKGGCSNYPLSGELRQGKLEALWFLCRGRQIGALRCRNRTSESKEFEHWPNGK
jgi:hypothetical protein